MNNRLIRLGSGLFAGFVIAIGYLMVTRGGIPYTNISF